MAAIGFRILPRIDTNRALVALFEGIPASIISDNLSRLTGTWGLSPMHRPGTALLGTALTVRVRSGDNLMIHKALQLGRPGDVLVIDGNGCVDRALMGEIMKNVAMARGFAGVVLDGAIRDSAAFREDGFPCYARGVCHRGPYKDGPGEINVPVSISGMVVQPGDIVVGDDDGVVFIAPHEAEAVAAASRRKLTEEATTMDAIARGAYDDRWIDATLAQKGVPL
ncbi:MAG TPA: RraA family protein [Quisquiliibacterium sp.]|mgnify:CR=1 FL=1|nr:RraA family protein [Quisquiliibacterium sp.]HPA89259.1 RraA family protein [Quisquiliibacterium sp.]HQD82816.1 RraA family protein [Quisquiliibacterium sp.]HQN10511.1 RraA family protein [Quisquiliibacterium sp.]HQP65661.1 RraA family protein [Quisquiliibacterium sp.]